MHSYTVHRHTRILSLTARLTSSKMRAEGHVNMLFAQKSLTANELPRTCLEKGLTSSQSYRSAL